MKDIYKMKLHEIFILADEESAFMTVMRVPGGWIYQFHIKQVNVSSTFVPWHDSGRQIASDGNYEELRAKLQNTENKLKKITDDLSVMSLKNTDLKNKLRNAEGCIDSIQSDIKSDGGSVSWLCKQYYGQNH